MAVRPVRTPFHLQVSSMEEFEAVCLAVASPMTMAPGSSQAQKGPLLGICPGLKCPRIAHGQAAVASLGEWEVEKVNVVEGTVRDWAEPGERR